jgi:hypothetical protein
VQRELDAIGKSNASPANNRDAAVSSPSTRARRYVAELLGTAFLLAAIVGSGVMGERLAGGNVAIRR